VTVSTAVGVTAVLTASVLVAACGGGSDRSFRAVDAASGATVSVSDVAGRPTLLAGWATWCVPCEHELPELEAAGPAFADAGVGLVLVNVDTPSVGDDAVAAVADRLAPTLPLWRDADSTLLATYDATFMPFSVLIDADGDVIESWNGAVDPDRVLAAAGA
jgi:thiol-disulfide isomerase/thioredoxin